MKICPVIDYTTTYASNRNQAFVVKYYYMKFKIKGILKNKKAILIISIVILTIITGLSFLIWKNKESRNYSYLFYLRKAKGVNVVFNENIKKSFEGVGVKFSLHQGVPIVIDVVNNSPAEANGIKSGDRILKIDGKSTSGMTECELSEKLRGKKGSQVTLTIYRNSFGNKTEEFLITRDYIDEIENYDTI